MRKDHILWIESIGTTSIGLMPFGAARDRQEI